MRREERTWHESVRASGTNCNPYRQKFPEQEVLSKDQACKLLGLDWDALVHNDGFPAKKVGKRYIIPIVPLARWMVTW